jgi:predicted TIM-barrel fold metal-dependent hydrolase
MIDAHIHTGQFREIWYDPDIVIPIILEAGVDRIVFSSTTSCKENIQYAEVEQEIESVLSMYGYSTQKVRPLLWYVPGYYDNGLGIERLMQTLPYGGIKIHPRAHNWDMENKKTLALLEELFGYADQYKLPVLIHTGYDKIDEAEKFGQYFTKYSNAKIVLAHCRPLNQALQLLLTNQNVYCDTAFMDEKTISVLFEKGLSSRIIPGSDFPITHYYNKDEYVNDVFISLKKQYEKDIQKLNRIDKNVNFHSSKYSFQLYFPEEAI